MTWLTIDASGFRGGSTERGGEGGAAGAVRVLLVRHLYRAEDQRQLFISACTTEHKDGRATRGDSQTKSKILVFES